ncbi:long-chain fatty acid--CoA ligase [Streptomyces pratens]|uniref:Long-chain fatty acid--CoA ligase n=1 Tax=Streptomyces pratens TaxID=887456 RepID=A0ABW1LRJ8_9ACTN
MHADINPATSVSRNAKYFRDSSALIYAGGNLTYGELEDRAARAASVFAEHGIAAGDRVAYLGMNSSAYIVTMLASMRLGAIYVPLNFRLTAPELRSALQRSGATVLVGEGAYVDAIDAIRDQTALKALLLVDDDPEAPAQAGRRRWESWSESTKAVTAWGPAIARDLDDPAVILFSSGSTGQPKGIVLTHGNLWWNSLNTDLRMDTQRRDVTLAGAPLFHIGALNSFTLRSLVRGGTVLIRRRFDPVDFLNDIESYQVKTTFAVPTMLDALEAVPDAWSRLSGLRTLVVSGAPVPPEQIRRFAERGVPIQQAWGATEFAPTATHMPVEATLDKPGSAGVPMPYTEVRVVDPATGEFVEPGTPGELVVRGPNVTPGYWEDPVATAAVFDDEGWFHSGDIGYEDEDGYFFIIDRIKDVIITGGENVYPAEVERVLRAVPGVSDVAVVGMPDSEWGETVVAVCCLTEGAEVTLEQVREYAGTQIARYKLPRQLEIVATMPRNATGKLDKPGIRALLHK